MTEPSHVRVPREPTRAMLEEVRGWSWAYYGERMSHAAAAACWRAMLRGMEDVADPKPTTERQLGRADGMVEAAAWLDDAAGLHVRGTEVWRHLAGAADFMRQRAAEIAPLAAPERSP